MTGAAVAARARALAGVRFRPQGRDPAHGLDCVGLVAVALDRSAPADHPMRCGDAARVAAAAAALGLRPAGDARPGDIVLFASGPGQLHLAVRTEDGLVHADAQARRVVERPGAPPWPVIAAWRIGEE